jgi:AcrR family transcriptional regulator
MAIQTNGAARPKEHGAKGKATRERILCAAEEVFGRRGYYDASISDITKLAGVAQGSFYIYFASKQAIFDELLETRAGEMHIALETAARAAGTLPEAQRAGFRAFFRWIGEHPWLYRVTRQAEFVNPDLRENFYRGFAERYGIALQKGMEARELPSSDPDLLVWAMMGMADFVAMRFIVWGGSPMSDAQVDAFVDIAMRALGVRSDVPTAAL